jgi:hypothetical protein
VIGNSQVLACLLVFARGFEGECRSSQADAFNLSMKTALERFFNLVERELNALRPAIDG